MKKSSPILLLGAMIALSAYLLPNLGAADDLPDRDVSIALAVPDISDNYIAYDIQKPADPVAIFQRDEFNDAIISLSAASYVEKNPAKKATDTSYSTYGTLKQTYGTNGYSHTGVIHDTIAGHWSIREANNGLVYYDDTSTGLALLGTHAAPTVLQT
jgi:hypothetical protein